MSLHDTAMSGALSMYDRLNQEDSSNGSALEPPSEGATKKLSRGISRATENADIVKYARKQLELGSIDMPEFTFSLPDLSIYPDEFRQFLEKELIEVGCLNSLENAGRLNWWCGGGKNRVLWPLATTGDGNCLLHAASLGMWGFHDRELSLRETLYETLSKGEFRLALFRRWRWRQMALNAAAGLSYTEAEWLSEWQSIVDMASAYPRNHNSTSYQSLEEIHILALAHVLRRPIIVVAETMLRDSEGVALAPIPFGGIYLPCEVPPASCHRTPLLLAYHSAHFSPLVTVDSSSDPSEGSIEGYSIPQVDPDNGQLYPVLFAVDPGPDWLWTASQDLLTCDPETMEILIREYLDCEYQVFTPDEVDRLSESDAARSKTAKQLMGVAKQFGSIGKSVSKKFWSMAKKPKSHTVSSSGGYGETLLCVRIRSKRHKFVDQMLQNYLESAHTRYLNGKQSNHSDSETGGSTASQKSYSCREMNYGAGKSKFYTASDSDSYVNACKLPGPSSNKDQTLYLSNSTFYNDTQEPKPELLSNTGINVVGPCRTLDCKFFGSAEKQFYCSQCWSDHRH